MSTNLEFPTWASDTQDLPTITRFCGPENETVLWNGKSSRAKYQITDASGDSITLNVRQLAALAGAIDIELWPADKG